MLRFDVIWLFLLLLMLGATRPLPRVAQDHPCGLWDQQDVAAYRNCLSTDPGIKTAFDALQAWGDKRIAQPVNVPAHKLEADGTWSFPAFKRGYQDAAGNWKWEWKFNTTLQQRSADVSNLGMIYAITGEDKYATFGKRILLEMADAYGNRQGSAVPDAHGYDHFAAYGFDGGDTGMFLAKVCHGYDLIYNLPSISVEERNRIERDLIRPLAEHLASAKYMYTGHGRWGLVCLYGIFVSGIVLNDDALVNSTLYGLDGTKEKITGGFLDCFKPGCLRDGVVWGAETKLEDQMAAVSIMTTVAEVMWHRGVDLYSYKDMAMKKSFDAAIAGADDAKIAKLLNSPGIDAFQYAFRRHQDARYLPLVRELRPSLTLAIGEHLPSLPAALLDAK